MVKRFDVYWVRLDPTLGSEIKKTRPAVIVSSNQDILELNTVIIIPLTSTIKNLPTRVNCKFQERNGSLATDQIRAIDKIRLIKKLGNLDKTYQKSLITKIQEMLK